MSVSLGLLQRLVDAMGDLTIPRAHMERHNRAVAHNLGEFTRILQHMQKQLRALEPETKAKPSLSLAEESLAVQSDLPHGPDMLLTGTTVRALSGSIDELSAIGGKLQEASGELHSLLLQQAAITKGLEEGLLGDHTPPLVPATADVLLVEAADKLFAIPHGIVAWVTHARVKELTDACAGAVPGLRYSGQEYPLRYLGAMLGMTESIAAGSHARYPVLLVNTAKQRAAIQVDRLLGNSRIKVQALGGVLGNLRWYTGGAILADGDIALLLDLKILLDSMASRDLAHE